MRFTLTILYLFSFFVLKAESKGKQIDSLSNKDYTELQNLFYNNLKNISNAKKYAIEILKKAKKEKDTIKIADGYHNLFMISTPDISIKYVDSIIELTKNLSHINYPSRGYLNKGVLLQNNKRLNVAFDYYVKAKYYAEKNNNDLHKVAANLNIAQLKLLIGNEREALKVFKSNYDFFQKKDISTKFHRPYIGTLQGLAFVYNKNRQLDSAKIYINEGLRKISKNKEKYGYSGLLLANGINSYHEGSYNKAIDTLKKLLSIPLQLEYEVTLAETNLFLAKSYNKINKPKISYEYLEKVNELVDSTNYTTNTREAFEMLLNIHKKRNNTEKQLEVLEKMIVLDSIANVNNTKLNIDIYQKYDSQKLISEKNKLLGNIKKQKKRSIVVSIILGIVILGFAFFLYRNYSKRLYYKKKFEALINDQSIDKGLETEKPTNLSKSIDLPEEIIEDILEKIKTFEEKNKFIDSKLTLTKLAKKFGTNSTYLSKIINHYKGQNFANYINDLRIDYAIEQLKTNPNYRKYTLKSIGEEIGFNNIQSFSKAFYKKTGIKPSFFLKELDNQNIKK
ncbi:helix-turn-helix domain-containing protein [Aquimarina gracilis]|uniref:Helix-turn-helix domain-containing protein n=1 Tax=Aquimarina gracilis TaxID=874422 RepID=A0ABU5ZZY3_9FLAO|nr:helix-turn-helix domain-containing protein [Aquimarina gracilis]MEB3347411.1 helix-turn-helix domain-containing protein [Aquimarina gracilis]